MSTQQNSSFTTIQTMPSSNWPQKDPIPMNSNYGNGNTLYEMPIIETSTNIHELPFTSKPPIQDIESDSLSSTATTVSRDSDAFAFSFQNLADAVWQAYGRHLSKAFCVLALVGYTIYFLFALKHSIDGATALIVITSITVFLVAYVWVRDNYGDVIYTNIFDPVLTFISKTWPYTRWIIIPGVSIALICYLAFNVVNNINQLQSISGMVFFVVYLYIFSKHPHRILWRPVIVGFMMQFILGILVLRWRPGYEAVKWLSDQIMTFINYALAGAAVVFGDPMLLFHPFIFVIMPMLIYLGAVMSILYYLGITQTIAAKMGWFMQVVMKTTTIESLGVTSNIFLNGMDTMLMLRPYLVKLTRSEFHCFLVGGHATVAGFAFATFVMFGAPPQYLISAAVMSAPATFAVCKLNYPETEESITKTQDDIMLEKGDETNVIEAGANGATVAGKTVTAVVVNYIGFLGLLAFLNATLSWIGGNIGYPQLSFETICSYIFVPLSLLMGVEWSECREVAKLVGIKIFTSEMLGYQELGKSISAGLSDRSASIATYALCGFSSLSTLAIAVGVWNSICPAKTSEMSNQLVRVIINANISCFLTACIAALLYDPDISSASAYNGIANKVMEVLPSYKDLMGLVGF